MAARREAVDVGEGGDRIVEEHHAVPRDDQIEGAVARRPAGGIAFDETHIGTIAGAALRRGDQCPGEIEPGHLRPGHGVGQREAGGAGAAADVEDAAAAQRERAGDERIVQRRERAIGAAPFPGPGLAGLSLPFGDCEHRVVLEHRRQAGERLSPGGRGLRGRRMAYRRA